MNKQKNSKSYKSDGVRPLGMLFIISVLIGMAAVSAIALFVWGWLGPFAGVLVTGGAFGIGTIIGMRWGKEMPDHE